MRLTNAIPSGLLLLFSTSLSAQTVREVISTPNAKHTLYKRIGLSTVDNDPKPFTGRFIVQNAQKEPMSEYNFVNGKQEGPYKEWNIKEDNVRFLWIDATYKNGKLNGPYHKWDKYYKDSPYIAVEAFYKNGILSGHYIERGSPSFIKKECDYVNGELDGKWIIYGNNKKIEILQFWKLGKRDSTHTWYYEDGTPQRIERYNKSGLEHGLFQEFYPDGKVKTEINYVNDSKHGQEKEYYENGQLEMVTNYVNGKKNGEELLYYENGKVSERRRFKMEEKFGKWTWYKEDGSISEETTY